MRRREIPAAALAVCAEIMSQHETHASLDTLFIYAGAPGDPPAGSKPAKALAWLRRVNRDESVTDPLRVFGRIIEALMERPLDAKNSWEAPLLEARARLTRVLQEHGLQYSIGGRLGSALGVSTKTLQDFIRERDLVAIAREFERATENVDGDPREAVSAASNILESVCKVYIDDEVLERPAKQDLQGVWAVVCKHLGFDPSQVEDQDLREILSGLISVVHGIGALRTHASSAHGAGRKSYRLEPRHARLAIHAAHTLTLFILETWKRRQE